MKMEFPLKELQSEIERLEMEWRVLMLTQKQKLTIWYINLNREEKNLSFEFTSCRNKERNNPLLSELDLLPELTEISNYINFSYFYIIVHTFLNYLRSQVSSLFIYIFVYHTFYRVFM